MMAPQTRIIVGMETVLLLTLQEEIGVIIMRGVIVAEVLRSNRTRFKRTNILIIILGRD